MTDIMSLQILGYVQLDLCHGHVHVLISSNYYMLLITLLQPQSNNKEQRKFSTFAENTRRHSYIKIAPFLGARQNVKLLLDHVYKMRREI